jgi:hypothetical protein
MPASDGLYSQETVLESYQDKIIATAGGGQGAAYPITTQIARVSTVATIADSVKLPPAVSGLTVAILNSGANSLNIFPATGDAINALAVNAAFALASGGATTYFICFSNGQWFTK